ncbi:MAG: DEAD/DEAH box helicase [Planctomycetota bacterium]|jgi:ATP-dependent RNA helicase RhlE
MKFDDLRLTQSLLAAIRTAGYETPTPIQAQAIPLILDDRDILGCAQTGTGKTAAFALPIIQKLMASRPPKRERHGRTSRSRILRALIVAPTRELAQQIADSFATYGRSSGLCHTVVYGGVNKNAQTRVLRRGVDILVATPGRLLDHISDRTVRLDAVNMLVLDEADHMLDMGFLPDIKRILRLVPAERQSLLFSATMPQTIRALARDILSDPASVEVARVSSPAESVVHQIYRVEKPSKPALLCSVLENTPYTRALVFTRTKYGADKVVRQLHTGGVAATAIHGNKSQSVRMRALEDFRSGKIGVLVATDIAARGLDIADVSHVINYDLTAEPETYIHRIGRTGRAGATGTALSFVSNDEHSSLRNIERLLRMPLTRAPDMPGYAASEPRPERAQKPRHKPSRGPSSTCKPRASGDSDGHIRRRPRRNRRKPGRQLARR